MSTMLWPDEIRKPDFGFLDDDVKVRSQEIAMAQSLIDALAGDFEPEAFTDEYREAVQALIDAKVEGRELVAAPVGEAEEGSVVDLMAALRASVEAAKKARSGGGTGRGAEDDAEEKPAPKKRAATSRAKAKKSA